MPGIIACLLDQGWFAVMARIVLTFMFWGSGLDKLIHFDKGVAEMAALGFTQPTLINALTVITQLSGALLIIVNRWTWLGAGALAVFTALTIPLVHNFWAKQDPDALHAFHTAAEHVSVIGALMIVAILSRRTGDGSNGALR